MTDMKKLVITCEHGGNQIPEQYHYLFENSLAKAELASHEGMDFGANELAHYLSKYAESSFFAEVSRLVVDLNRSLTHPNLFSDYIKTLSHEERDQILQVHYLPFRSEVENQIALFIAQGYQVIHLSIHSFVGSINGKPRNADVGLLYDPSRLFEKAYCQKWRAELEELAPHLRVRFNYPYLGKSDGFTTYLRRKFDEPAYSGIEVEFNQRFMHQDETTAWNALKDILKESVRIMFKPNLVQETVR